MMHAFSSKRSAIAHQRRLPDVFIENSRFSRGDLEASGPGRLGAAAHCFSKRYSASPLPYGKRSTSSCFALRSADA